MNLLGNHLWQSTLVGLAAALAALALRRNSAQVRYRIWLIASLKFILPFSLLVSLGSHMHLPRLATAAPAALSGAVRQAAQPFVPFRAPFVFVASGGITHSSHAMNLVPLVLMGVWLCGFMFVLAGWTKQWLKIRKAVAMAAPLALETPIRALSTKCLLEPGVFGVFRPVLLIPDGITARLTRAHMDTILAHELCHVRRRDNLAAAIHMFIEALFWFHPLVWWIGARLVEERERACDEEVLRLGKTPRIYVESILKTCEYYLESPLPCLSGVTGSDLKKRVVQIMEGQLAQHLSLRKRMLLAAAATVVVALPLAAGMMGALPGRFQSQPSAAAPTASFEVASIKPAKPDGQGRMMVRVQPGGRFTASGITLKFLMEEAYRVKDAQISQAPPWFDSDRFDLDAKPEDSAGAAMDKLTPNERQERLMQMIKNLLADRFKLELGHETKELPIYAMVVAKSGSKLKPSTFVESDKPPANLPPPNRGGAPPPGGIWMQGPGKLTSTGVGLDVLADILSRSTGHTVVDKTGLTGRYDFTLQWTPDESQGGAFAGAPRQAPSGDGSAPTEPAAPSLFTAVQEQLGLKLESQKAPLDVLVIKHVEKPSEN